MNGELIWVLS
ncbi:citrate transporter, partial [Salmonella enterica subsp. enterica serovar Infantis]